MNIVFLTTELLQIELLILYHKLKKTTIMKTFITLVTLGLSFSLANAQTLKEAQVPAAVKDALKKQYPNAKVEKWEKEGKNYEAEIEIGNAESSVVYDENGVLLETEIEIKVSELPKAVFEYFAKKFPEKKIKEASKITSANGKISYEAEVGDKDYIFDAEGNFVSEEQEKNDKD